MKQLQLNDFNEWKKLNEGKSFGFYDYVYLYFNEKEISSDVLIAVFEVFWPTFIVYNGCIFLKENFSQQKYDQIDDVTKKEYWINLFLISSYFEDVDDGYEKAGYLSAKMVDIWKCKLKIEFPNLEFIVKHVYDEENGDCGITFYQVDGALRHDL